MSYKLSFGKYKGKTYEWVFFKAPWYAEWIYQNEIYRQPYNFETEERYYFLELFRRASCLGGVCRQCNERPVTRMGLTTHFNSGDLSAVGFYCDECEYRGGAVTGYERPSFFVETHTLPRCEQLRITHEIQRNYIETARLTQMRMDTFFQNDAFFPNGQKEAFTTPVHEGGLLVVEPP